MCSSDLWTWIQHTNFASTRATTTQKNKSKAKFFITTTAFFSVEMNAHNLLYITLAIREQQLPIEALNVYLFNSQGCESMFRNARALSGTYSSIVNYTVADFLRRSQKISILNRIKCDQVYDEENVEYLSFPVHHKHKKDAQSHATEDNNDIDRLDIEQIISTKTCIWTTTVTTARSLTNSVKLMKMMSVLYMKKATKRTVFNRRRQTSMV